MDVLGMRPSHGSLGRTVRDWEKGREAELGFGDPREITL
jgi:hypothetical protein